MKRRSFIKSGSAVVAGLSILGSKSVMASTINDSNYTLPSLPFNYADLEPHIDEATMIIHHTKHHASYVAKLNKEASTWSNSPSLEELMGSISKYNTATRNNGGGHYNHSFFWNILCPPNHPGPDAKLLDSINKQFGSLAQFQAQFKSVAMSVFGSGWTWLIVDKKGDLKIVSTANQDNPLMDDSPVKGTPILALDVWEHAYYIKHQNLRGDYIDSFWAVVNWNQAALNFQKTGK